MTDRYYSCIDVMINQENKALRCERKSLMLMNVQETEDKITKIILSGRLDINGSLEIDKDFMDVIKVKKDVVVDMSEVTFIMSLGMRTLVSGAKEAAKNGGKLVIYNPQANVEDALIESSLDTILPIINSNTDLKKLFGK